MICLSYWQYWQCSLLCTTHLMKTFTRLLQSNLPLISQCGIHKAFARWRQSICYICQNIYQLVLTISCSSYGEVFYNPHIDRCITFLKPLIKVSGFWVVIEEFHYLSRSKIHCQKLHLLSAHCYLLSECLNSHRSGHFAH